MIIISLDDFKRYVRLAKRQGKWKAWREDYFVRYEEVFSAMLKYLYRNTVESLKEAVEYLDADKALATAQAFLREGGVLWVDEWLGKAEAICPFEREYVLYYLIGLGHVDGTALPARKPFLYLGLERYQSMDRVKYLAPHEYSHMVRLWDVEGGEPREYSTFGDMVVEEGLATVFSSIVTQGDMREALLMSEMDFAFCDAHRDKLVREVMEHWDRPISNDLLEKYLRGRHEWRDGRPTRIGYFVGAQVVEKLLAQGYTISELMKLPAKETIARYRMLVGTMEG